MDICSQLEEVIAWTREQLDVASPDEADSLVDLMDAARTAKNRMFPEGASPQHDGFAYDAERRHSTFWKSPPGYHR